MQNATRVSCLPMLTLPAPRCTRRYSLRASRSGGVPPLLCLPAETGLHWWLAMKRLSGPFARSERSLTPRSSGAPTAAHQARPVVRMHFPQPGPGGPPLGPA